MKREEIQMILKRYQRAKELRVKYFKDKETEREYMFPSLVAKSKTKQLNKVDI